MSGSTSCARCQRPLPAEATAGGLCETCRRALATPVSVSAPPRTFTAYDTTASGAGADPAAPTATGRPAAPARPAPEPPPIPGYEFLGVLGEGGMGTVYKARELAADRVVALKVIRLLTDRVAQDRFQVEVRSLARLRHPNIVQVFAVQLDGREPFFTMECIDGPGLDRRLKAAGPLDPPEAARIVELVARAIHAAHQAGVIHRDLKPGNIVLASDGTPKVTDFGLAKRLDADEGLTVPEALLGTPGFMSPEQAGRRNREIGPASDVYALGATLYALLTGGPPFRGRDSSEVAARVRSDPPTPPRKVRKDVAPDLEAVVLKCLEKESRDRYPSAAALADDLARWRAGQPTTARPAGLWRRAVLARRRLAAAGLVVLAAAGLAWAGVALSGDRTGPPPDPLAEIQADLDAGRPVTLVPETGLPRWGEWRLVPSSLTAPPLTGGAATFQTSGATLLELLPDPRVDRYRVEAELLHVAGDRPPPNWPMTNSYVGLYFGFAAREAEDGWWMNTLFAARFTDAPLEGPLPPGQPSVKASAQFGYGLYPHRADRSPAPRWNGRNNLSFDPPANWPGRWRKLRVDVSPDEVVVRWWDDKAGALVELYKMTGNEARDSYASLRRNVTDVAPGSAVGPPPWHPRMPLGVIADRATVAFKNVVVTPHP